MLPAGTAVTPAAYTWEPLITAIPHCKPTITIGKLDFTGGLGAQLDAMTSTSSISLWNWIVGQGIPFREYC